MSGAVDLSTYGKDIKRAYETILDPSSSQDWVLFSYSQNTLKVLRSGSGGLEELQDEFEDSKMQYAFCRVNDNDLPKYVFISWCGEGVPVLKKAMMPSHLDQIRSVLKGFHVEVSARTDEDVDPQFIMNKVKRSGGSKYGTKQAELSHLKTDIPDDGINEPVGSNYVRPEIIPAMPRTPSQEELNESNLNSPQQLRKQREQADRELIEREKKLQKERELVAARLEEERKKQAQEEEQNRLKRLAQLQKEKMAQESSKRSKPPSIPAPVPSKTSAPAKHDAEPAEESKPDAEGRYVGAAAKYMETVASQTRSVKNIWAQREKQSMLEQNSRPGTGSSSGSSAAMEHRQKREAEERKLVELEKQRQKEREEKEAEIKLEARVEQEISVPEQTKPVAPRLPPPRPQPPVSDNDDDDDDGFSQEEEEEEISEAEKKKLFRARLNKQIEQEEANVPEPEPEPVQLSQEPAPEQIEVQNATSTDKKPVVSLYSFEATEEGEMSLEEGDQISNYFEVAPGWWHGEVLDEASGSVLKAGLFPSNYIEQLPDHSPDEGSGQVPTQVIALFGYEASDETEISFSEGDLILDVAAVTDDWWSGKGPDGRMGLFPANYVEKA